MAKIEDNFRFLGQLDVSVFKEKVLTLPENYWEDVVGKFFGVHKNCRSIFFKNDLRPEHYFGTYHPLYETFKDELTPILDLISKQYPKGHFIRIQLSRHLPGYGFGRHHDDFFSKTLVKSHRIHVPISTNENTWFEVADERKVFKEGEIWEIDNLKQHEGANEGDTPRINLIVDFARELSTDKEKVEYFLNLHKSFNGLGHLFYRLNTNQKDISAPEDFQNKILSLKLNIRNAKNGKLLCSNENGEPIKFLFGKAMLPAAIEERLTQMTLNDVQTFTLKADQAYGKRDMRLISYENKKLNKKINEVIEDSNGNLYVVRKYPFGNKTITDANHWYAGLNLEIDLEITDIRALDQYEISSFNFQMPKVKHPLYEN